MERGELSREQVLKAKKAEYRVFRKGMYQRIVFTVKIVKEPYGEYPVLFSDRIIDIKDAARLSEELQIPLEIPNGKVYPKGKSGKDFVELMSKL